MISSEDGNREKKNNVFYVQTSRAPISDWRVCCVGDGKMCCRVTRNFRDYFELIFNGKLVEISIKFFDKSE